MLVISPSSASSWTDCPRRELARRYPQLIPPKYKMRKLKFRIAGQRGTVGHSIFAKLLERKKETGENWLPSNDELDVLVSEAIDENMKKGKVNFFQTIWDQTTTGPDDLRKTVKQLAKSFAVSVLPRVFPEFIEQTFRAPLFPGVELEGTPDFTSFNRETGRRKLVDDKTGKESPFQLQLGLYSILLKACGYVVDEMEVNLIPAVAPGKPGKPVETIPYNVEICEEEAYTEAKLIYRDVSDFKRTNDLQSLTANLRSNLCNQTDCPLWGTNGCRVATNGEIIDD